MDEFLNLCNIKIRNFGSQYTLSTRYLVFYPDLVLIAGGWLYEARNEILILVDWLGTGEEVCVDVFAFAMCNAESLEAAFVSGPVVLHLHGF